MAFRTFTEFVSAAAVLLAASNAALAAGKIAIITPYLAQPGTQYYVESFQDRRQGKRLERQCHRHQGRRRRA